MTSHKLQTLCLLVLAALPAATFGQHVHLNAGALSPSPGSQTYFANAASFVASSGFVANMVLRTNGPAVGLYDGGVTFTALAIDELSGGPEPGHAAPGAQLALLVKSLSGPPDSEWAFWESAACEDFGSGITFRLRSGDTNGTNLFLLSQNSGLPGEDPYGHCHGRRFTTSKPGLHTLGVQIVDLSRNGPGGGPVHTPSEVYFLHFQAGTTISRLDRTNSSSIVTFGTRTGSSYYLESNPVLDSSQPWTTIAGPMTGNNRLRQLADPALPTALQRFYRLRVTTP